jgi:hypothetical protein
MIRGLWQLAKPVAYATAAAVCLALAVALEAAARELEARGEL